MKLLFRKPLLCMVIGELIIAMILIAFGFKITYAPQLENNWEAISAVGQWASAIVGILIPIAVIYIEEQLQSSKVEIGEANIALLNEINDFKQKQNEKEISIKTVQNEVKLFKVGNGSLKENKTEALKFITISITTTTDRVAHHLGISEDETFDLLVEMMNKDKLISCDGKCKRETKNKIHWKKKR